MRVKNIFKRLTIFMLIITSFVFINACSCKEEETVKVVPTFESFEIMGEGLTPLNETNSSGDAELLSLDNPFGEGKKTIEEKINEEIGLGETITIDYETNVNQYVYAVTKIKNPDNLSIASVTISGQRYTNNLFEAESSREKIIIKLSIGDKKAINHYTLESLKYMGGGSIKDVEIPKNTRKVVKVGQISDIHHTLNNVSVTDNSYSFNLKVTDNDALVEGTKGKIIAVLFNGENLIQKINVHIGIQTIKFENLEKDKIYQYAIVVTYDKLDGNGKKNYILEKNVVETQIYTIRKATSYNGTFEVKDSAVFGESVSVIATSNKEYTVAEMYYIEENSNEKKYFDNEFIMPKNAITIYVVFEKKYNIYTKEQLITLLKDDSNWNSDFVLHNDINLGNMEWIPIGNDYKPFTGTFDGNNHKIYNFKVNSRYEMVGFFGKISNSEVKNLRLENATIDKNYFYYYDSIGILCGKMEDSNLSNVYVDGSINISIFDSGNTEFSIDVGGVVGRAYGKNIVIEKNHSNVNISSAIESVYKIGKITIGGILGDLDDLYNTGFSVLEIKDSYSTGNIFGEQKYKHQSAGGEQWINPIEVGGILGVSSGHRSNLNYVYIDNCYSSMDIDVYDSYAPTTGGIVGSNVWSNIYIDNCYYSGNVNSNTPEIYQNNVGYILGSSGKSLVDSYIYISNCFMNENSIIQGQHVRVSEDAKKVSMQQIWQFVYNNWDRNVWNLSLNQNPTFKN